MTGRQFRILYREFLFRIVDRELLSTHAKGDMSQLLLQLVALLTFLSVCFSVPALLIEPAGSTQARVLQTWTIEHFLIATTMLVAGVFAVLSWGSVFPDQRDVLVLSPLPIGARTILLAKLAGVVTALGAAILALQVVAGVAWPTWLSMRQPARAMLALTSDPVMPPAPVTRLSEVLDRDFDEMLRHGPLAPRGGGGVVIGVSQRGERHVFAYGAATNDSIFQVGSITKTFTGLVLARMVADGQVRLEEPVRELIPQARVPQPAGPEITLLDLATHHSGLPRMPGDFRPLNPADPYAAFDVERLYAFLHRRGVARRANPPLVYSNVGFGLLGHALANRAGVDYTALVRESVIAPLGLHDTGVTLSADQRRRFLQGYDDNRQPVPAWNLQNALAGAGALRSTAPDMLTWLEANLHPERAPGPLAIALAESQAPQVDLGPHARLALAWMLDTRSGDIAHGGATAGFSAHVFFNRRDDLAVVTLANAAPGTPVSADVVAEHVRARLRGEPPVSLSENIMPAAGGFGSWVRIFLGYWGTMVAAGLFVFGFAAGVQGIAAAILPQRYFLRASAFLQIGTFATIVSTYFLQPIGVQPATLLDAQREGALGPSPSYWFLGLFQALTGSPALAPLAGRAWQGLGIVVIVAAAAYVVSYLRTIRRIAEQPEVVAAPWRWRLWPRTGNGFQTAIVQFSLRTLFRSAQQRMILAFYWGAGFAFAIIAVKLPRTQQFDAESLGQSWQNGSVPLLVSSIVMICFAVLGPRLAFSIPKDFRANWIFRLMPGQRAGAYLTAQRQVLVLVGAVPVWIAAAGTFVWLWPWLPALAHLAALGILGLVIIEIALSRVVAIPFTRAYLPGKSRAHIAIYIAAVLILPAALTAARFERDALEQPLLYGEMIAALAAAWMVLRLMNHWHTSHAAEPDFEDEPPDKVLTLDVWDSRFRSRT